MGRRPGAARDWVKPRSVRVPEDVWAAAKVEAARRGETVTDVVVRALRRYGNTNVRSRS